MNDKKHDIEFEREVLSQCLKDPIYLRDAAPILKRRHFELKEHSWIWEVILKTWREFSEIPKVKKFVSEANRSFPDDDDRIPYLKTLKQIVDYDITSPDSSLDELRRFVRAAELEITLNKTVSFMEKGDWDSAYDPIVELVRNDLKSRSYTVSRWAEEANERQKEREDRKLHPDRYKTIPTGFRTIDRRIVGMQEGEFGLILGFTGRGKSIFCNHIGFQAICRGYNVVHFSTEMVADRVAQRYDSRFSGIEYKTFKHYLFNQEELENYNKLIQQGKKRFEGRLRIISTPLRYCDINMIRTALDDMLVEMKGNKIDMVIVDSGDHMQTIGNVENYRLSQANVYTDLKNLADEFGYVVWSTAQVGREWENKIATASSVSESLDKARLADLVLSINEPQNRSAKFSVIKKDNGDKEDMSADDIDDIKHGDLEICVSKVRDDESKFSFRVESDLSRMLIREIKEVNRKWQQP